MLLLRGSCCTYQGSRRTDSCGLHVHPCSTRLPELIQHTSGCHSIPQWCLRQDMMCTSRRQHVDVCIDRPKQHAVHAMAASSNFNGSGAPQALCSTCQCVLQECSSCSKPTITKAFGGSPLLRTFCRSPGLRGGQCPLLAVGFLPSRRRPYAPCTGHPPVCKPSLACTHAWGVTHDPDVMVHPGHTHVQTVVKSG
jgi:hypothetical protein